MISILLLTSLGVFFYQTYSFLHQKLKHDKRVEEIEKFEARFPVDRYFESYGSVVDDLNFLIFNNSDSEVSDYLFGDLGNNEKCNKNNLEQLLVKIKSQLVNLNFNQSGYYDSNDIKIFHHYFDTHVEKKIGKANRGYIIPPNDYYLDFTFASIKQFYEFAIYPQLLRHEELLKKSNINKTEIPEINYKSFEEATKALGSVYFYNPKSNINRNEIYKNASFNSESKSSNQFEMDLDLGAIYSFDLFKEKFKVFREICQEFEEAQKMIRQSAKIFVKDKNGTTHQITDWLNMSSDDLKRISASLPYEYQIDYYNSKFKTNRPNPFPSYLTETFKDYSFYSEYLDPYEFRLHIDQAKQELEEKLYEKVFLNNLILLIGLNIVVVAVLRILNWLIYGNSIS